MKVKYTGNAGTLNCHTIYTVVDNDCCGNNYKVRNDNGRLEWYAKCNFVEVKEKAATSSQVVSANLISEIEREIKDTEKRMADLRKKLEDAKNPPTDNILLRQTRLGRYWIDEVDDALDNFACALVDSLEGLEKGLALEITHEGDGITLDGDYRWEIRQDGNGQVLLLLDK